MENANKREDLYKANMYSLRCLWIATVIGVLAWVLEVLQIFIVDFRLVTVTVAGALVLLLLAYVVKKTLGYERRLSSYIMLLLLVTEFTFGCVMLTYHVLLFMLFPMVCAVLYNEEIYMKYTFGLTALGFLVAVIFGFRFGLCDANMLLLTTTTTANETEMITGGQYAINSDLFPLALYYAFPRILTLLGFSSLLSQIKKHIRSYAIRENEIRRKAETDGLTGLYNQSKLLELMESASASTLAAIYMDINDLKKVNDSLGHEHGDALINGMANILQSYQTDRILAYRVGGDEFVLMVLNPEKGEAKRLAEQIRGDTEAAVPEFHLRLSAAIGYAEGSSSDIRTVMNEADEMMYMNKQEMKKRLSGET